MKALFTKNEANRILITGATGYIGGSLVSRLLDNGWRVRAVGRSLEKLESRSWSKDPNLEIHQADLLDRQLITELAKGCVSGYYLMPASNPLNADFSTDLKMAENVRFAAENAGWRQLINLRGLPREEKIANPYLISRSSVEAVLISGKTPVTSIHSDIVFGVGSVMFEIMRSLVSRFKTIFIQQWAKTQFRPIELDTLIDYLAAVLGLPEAVNRSFAVGGAEWTTFQDMIAAYGSENGTGPFRFFQLPIPSARLCAVWLHLLTPVPAASIFMLTSNLWFPVKHRDSVIDEIVSVRRFSIEASIRRVIKRDKEMAVSSHWSDAGVTPPIDWLPESSAQGEERKLYSDRRSLVLNTRPENIWQSLVRIGGETGWYYGNFLWQLRGLMDRLAGGVGLKRGRRHPEDLRPGDALDMWRARIVDKPSRLLLVAEMKLPGKAILDFQIQPIGEDQSEIIQTAWYEAHGILGILYWYSVLPFHAFIFQGMIEGIERATRYSYRYSYSGDVVIKMDRQSVNGSFINLSSGGCKVFSPEPVTRFAIMEIRIPGLEIVRSPVQYIGQYRVRDGYHLSLRFDAFSQVFSDWLENTLATLE